MEKIGSDYFFNKKPSDFFTQEKKNGCDFWHITKCLRTPVSIPQT